MKPFRLGLFLTLLTHSLIAAQNYRLTPATTFGPHNDGSLRPNDVPVLSADGNRYQRGMALNPLTGHLLVVNRQPANLAIGIIDAGGSQIGNLDFQGFLPGGHIDFPINLVGVAEDGAIYVGNLTTTSTPPEFRLYRWSSESGGQTLVYSGDPGNGDTDSANRRWGDTLAVRGSGITTEILIASRGTLVAILRPTDASLATFTATTLVSDAGSGALGYGLAFGAGNTFYGTAGAGTGGGLYRMGYDSGAGTATVLQRFGSSVVPNNFGPLGANVASNLFAGLSFVPGPDLVRLYDVSTADAAPAFLDRASFVTDTNNGVFAGAVAIGHGRVYALNSDNGLMAFNLVESSAPVLPALYLQPINRAILVSSNVTYTVAADGTLPLHYQWYINRTNFIEGATNSSYVITNTQVAASGFYSAVVSNDAGAVTSSVASLTVTESPLASRVVYEPFNYSPSSEVNGQGGWVINSGTSATVEAGNLTVSGLASPTGNRIAWGTNAMSLRLPLGTNVTRGSIMYSFAMRVDSLGSGFTANGVLSGLTTGTGTSFGSKIDIRNNGAGGYNLGVSKAGTGSQIFATNDYAVSNTLFVVARYTFNNNTADDVSELWVNPPAGSFGSDTAPAPTLTTTGGTDLSQIDRFFFRAGSTTSTPEKLVTDELRVGLTWKDVTPPPVLTRPTLQISHVGNDVVLTWPITTPPFTLESAGSLPATEWEAAGGTVASNNGTNSVRFGAGSGNRFFRLRQ